MTIISWGRLSPAMQRAIISLAEDESPHKLHSHTKGALESRGLIFSTWEGDTADESELRVRLTALGWDVYRQYKPATPPEAHGMRLDIAFENEGTRVAASIQVNPPKKSGRGLILVVTFDGTEIDEDLAKVQEAIRYLRERGHTVEEKDVEP